MNERDVRLLFDAGHWRGAKVVKDAIGNGWHALLLPKNPDHPTTLLSAKRGYPRLFKTSDAAISWCREIGISDVAIQFEYATDEVKPLAATSKIVLLVEDNRDDVDLTMRAFEKSHIENQIVVAKDGQEAIDYLFAQGTYVSRSPKELPSLILLDINLPKINGLEVLKLIRQNPTTRHVPVVLLTTSDEETDIILGYQYGSNSYIKKPVSFQVFIDVINDLSQYWLSTNTPPPQ